MLQPTSLFMNFLAWDNFVGIFNPLGTEVILGALRGFDMS